MRDDLAERATEEARPGAPSPAVRTRIPTSSELREFMPLVSEVVSVVMARLPPNVLRDDLMAAGTYCLHRTLSREMTRGPAFVAYLKIRIHGALIDELRAQDWLSRSARKAESGRPEPNDRRLIVSLEELPSRGADLVAPTEDVDFVIDRHERLVTILGAVDALPDRQRRLIRMVYFEGMLLKDVARRLRLSTARVSQLHAQAMSILKAELAA